MSEKADPNMASGLADYFDPWATAPEPPLAEVIESFERIYAAITTMEPAIDPENADPELDTMFGETLVALFHSIRQFNIYLRHAECDIPGETLRQLKAMLRYYPATTRAEIIQSFIALRESGFSDLLDNAIYSKLENLRLDLPYTPGKILATAERIIAARREHRRQLDGMTQAERVKVFTSGLDDDGQPVKGSYYHFFRPLFRGGTATPKHAIITTSKAENIFLVQSDKPVIEMDISKGRGAGVLVPIILNFENGPPRLIVKTKNSPIKDPYHLGYFAESIHGVLAGGRVPYSRKAPGKPYTVNTLARALFDIDNISLKSDMAQKIMRTCEALISTFVGIDDELERAQFRQNPTFSKINGKPVLMPIVPGNITKGYVNNVWSDWILYVSNDTNQPFPIIEYSRRAGEIEDVPIELIKIPGNHTEDKLKVSHDLIRAVALMKRTHRDGTPYRNNVITYASLFANYNDVSKQARSKDRGTVRDILDHFQSQGYIAGYEDAPLAGQKETGIEIILN